jgi:hypothetical protein
MRSGSDGPRDGRAARYATHVERVNVADDPMSEGER